MLLLFVWFLLFKFPPARRGKQSLTVKQIGTFFFFVDLIIWSRRSNTNCSRDNGGSSDWICFLFHCVIFFSIRGSDRVITLCPMAPPHERNYNELSLLWVTEGWETRFASFIAKRERICHDIVVRSGCQLQDRKKARLVMQHTAIFSRTKRTHLYLLF